MQYVLLIYETPKAFEQREAQEGDFVAAWRAYYQATVAAGIFAGGNPLESSGTATTVRQRDDQRSIQDGPYANTKEQLGGFMLLELPSLDAAIDWASRCPAAAYGAVEVRPYAPATHERITSE